jgi:hypothetical protein
LPDVRGNGNLGLKWICKNTTPKLTKVGSTHFHYHGNIAGLLNHGVIEWLGNVSINGKIVGGLNWYRTTEDYYETTIDTDGGNTDVQTTIRVYLGTETQTADSTLNGFHAGQTHPAYKGQAYVVFQNLYMGDGRAQVPNVSIQFRATCPFTHDATEYGNLAFAEGVNPINHLVHLVTHPRAGLGIDQDVAFDMDDIAAKQLAIESQANATYGEAQRGFISPLLTKQKKAKDWIKENLSYYDGFISLDETKLKVDWFPHSTITETDPSQFRTIYLADLVSKPSIDLPVWEDTITGVAIDYFSLEKDFRQTALTIRSSHASQVHGEERIETLTRDWFTWEKQIQSFGERYLATAEIPRYKGKIQVKRDRCFNLDNGNVAAAIRGELFKPGHLFKFNYAPFSLNLICRITGISPKGAVWEIDFVQERGTYPADYVPTPDPIPDLTLPTPDALDNWEVINAPFGLINERKNWLVIFAERFDKATTEFDITFNDSNTWISEEPYLIEQTAFGVRFELNETVANEAGPTTFEIEANAANPDLLAMMQEQDDSQQANDDLLLQMNGEWMSIGAISLVSGTAYDVTCLRGRLGSAAQGHSATNIAWVIKREDLSLWYHKKFDDVYTGNAYDAAKASKYFKTRTRNIFGNESAWSASINYVLDDQIPPVPTGLVATAIAEGVSLTWDDVAVPDFNLYRVAIDTDPGFASPSYRVATANAFTVSGYTSATTLYFKVLQQDRQANYSAFSSSVSATTLEVSDGLPGDDGLSVYVATVFRRSASAPGTPTGGSYNFTTNTLTAPASWAQALPAGTDPLYSSIATFSVVGQTGTDSSTTWSSPEKVLENGTDGTDGDPGAEGKSVHVSTIYRRSASAPSTPTGGSYNFGTLTLTPPASWSGAFVDGSDPLYASTGSWSVTDATATDSSTTWSSPVRIVEDGAKGNKTVRIYKADSSGVATGNTGNGIPAGWSVTKPAAGIIWQSESEQTFDDLLVGSWTTPVRTDGTVTLFDDKDAIATAILIEGDVVFDNTENNRIYRWNGSAWVDAQKVLDDGEVLTAKLTDNAITLAKMAADSVGNSQLIADSVTATKIATGAVTADSIAANSIRAVQIGTEEIIASTANIANGIITNAKISDLSVAKLTAGTITSKEIIIAGTAGSGKIRSDNFVTGAGGSGWQIADDGIEVNDGTFRGTLYITDAKQRIEISPGLMRIGLLTENAAQDLPRAYVNNVCSSDATTNFANSEIAAESNDGAELGFIGHLVYSQNGGTVVSSGWYANAEVVKISNDLEGGRLDIYNDAGSSRIALDVASDAGVVSVLDSNGNLGTTLNSNTYGGYFYAYSKVDPNSPRVTAQVNATDYGLVSVRGPSETNSAIIYATADGGRLDIQDEAANLRIYLRVRDADGNTELQLRDSAGNNDIYLQTGTRNKLYVAGGLFTHYTSADTDITALIGGSTFGTLIQGPASGHVVVGLAANDSSDSFSVIANTGGDGAGVGSYDDCLLNLNLSDAFFRTHLVIDEHAFRIRNATDETKVFMQIASDGGALQLYDSSDLEKVRLWTEGSSWIDNVNGFRIGGSNMTPVKQIRYIQHSVGFGDSGDTANLQTFFIAHNMGVVPEVAWINCENNQIACGYDHASSTTTNAYFWARGINGYSFWDTQQFHIMIADI